MEQTIAKWRLTEERPFFKGLFQGDITGPLGNLQLYLWGFSHGSLYSWGLICLCKTQRWNWPPKCGDNQNTSKVTHGHHWSGSDGCRPSYIKVEQRCLAGDWQLPWPWEARFQTGLLNNISFRKLCKSQFCKTFLINNIKYMCQNWVGLICFFSRNIVISIKVCLF